LFREQSLVAEAKIMARQHIKQEQKIKEIQQQEEKEATGEMRRLLLKQMEEKAAQETRSSLQV
jgi:hypothetical protein